MAPLREEILRLIRLVPGLSIDDIAERTGRRRQDALRTLNALEVAGAITCGERGRSEAYYVKP